MVSYLLRTAPVRRLAARAPDNPAQTASPSPPRGAARDVLLHHHRLAQLAPGEAALLVHPRVPDRERDGLQASRRRHEVGPEAVLRYYNAHRRRRIGPGRLFYFCHANFYRTETFYSIRYTRYCSSLFFFSPFFLLSKVGFAQRNQSI